MQILDHQNFCSSHFVQLFGNEGEYLRNRMVRKRKEANDRGLEFLLTLSDIKMLADKLCGRGNCDYTDIPFPVGSIHQSEHPTLERIDDKKGYVRGNVCVAIQRVNQLKDQLIDKIDRKATIQAGEQRYVKAMFEHMSPEHMEYLKTKYIPDFEYAINEEGELVEIRNQDKETITLHGVGDHKVEVEKIVEQKEVKENTVNTVPDDVIIAERYAGLLRFLAKHNHEITISFAHFKAAYRAKRCFITGKELTEDMSPVIMDKSKAIEAGNLKFAEEKAAHALNELVTTTGLSVADLVKNLKKVV
ncbi:hypothetical protein [Salmonella phage SSBI34]|nr:hypothetical protein [Salmonella phage SSBI34]